MERQAPGVRAIFDQAREIDSPGERAAFLDGACEHAPDVRAEVEALLRAGEEAGSFLETPAVERLAAGSGADDTRTSPVAGDGDDGLDFLEPSEKPGSIGRLGHYEVQEVVGRGGMGIVLKAFDERLHRVVAIKVMAPQLATSAAARKRFTREARAQAAVTHDHVVTIHAVEDAGPLPYIVMQFVAGASLQDRLDRTGPLPLAEVLRIGMQAAAGLAAAHAQGLVHRDVKPANILLENGVERVKLTDFGLARAADDASLTQSGAVAGTPAFMSPEQAEGKPVDPRSDLFSLGSVLYAMCTGRPPFRAGTSMGVLKRVCEETPTPIRQVNPEVPDWLAAAVEKLHAKDPAGRFPSATEVAELLGRQLAHVQHPSVVPLPAVANSADETTPARPARRKKWAAAAAVLVAVFAVLGATEATGVTNVRATVLRVFTPDGTLVVETDDPDVKVTVEGDGGLVVSGAGLREIHLKPGSYRVLADRDGKPVPLDRELVSVSRHGREIVRVKLEAPPVAPAPTTEKGAFALLAAGKELKFDTLADAVEGASDGDTIEIHGNGPFISQPVLIADRRALTIRAGTGFRPVLRLGRGAGEDQHYLLSTNGPVVLEGLDVLCERQAGPQSSAGFTAVSAFGGPMHVANCRFVAPYRHSLYAPGTRRVVVVNCEFLGSQAWYDGLTGSLTAAAVWELENCVQVGGALVSCGANSPDARGNRVRIRRCSLTYCQPLYCSLDAAPRDPESGAPARWVDLELTGNLFGPARLLGAAASQQFREKDNPLRNAAPGEALSRLVGWHGSNNVHDLTGTAAVWDTDGGGQRVAGVDDLPTWRRFWDSPETGSIEGQVRYQGGDLAGRSTHGAEKLSPEDFRLRPDSAGYRAGKDGKDLGADVDLLGPGPAYERWKKTPDYQQWLQDVTRPRVQAPPRERNAFVVLGGPGVAERKFDTLAEAVLGSSDGDTIEVRGNGPFDCRPIQLGRRRLTIRASKGCRPIVRLATVKGGGSTLFEGGLAIALEGLDFQSDGPHPGGSNVWIGGPVSLHVANCRFHTRRFYCIWTTGATQHCVLKNCEFYSEAVAGELKTGGGWVIDNCVHLGPIFAFNPLPDHTNASVRITRTTCVARDYVMLTWADAPAGKVPAVPVLRMQVSESVLNANAILQANQNGKRLPTAEYDTLARRLFTWGGERNLYAVRSGNTGIASFRTGDVVPDKLPWQPGPKDLAGWKDFWTSPETGSAEGRPVYQGGDLWSREWDTPGKLTPEDFRLRPNSPGYRAGKDNKDLGADVDLVGPGPAYERWKKTPEYQVWLKETGQLKK